MESRILQREITAPICLGYRNQLAKPQRILVISPHSDDAALSLAYFLHSQVAATRIDHVTVFSQSMFGEPPGDRAAISAQRQREDAEYFEGLRSAGQQIRHQNLGYDDAQIRLDVGSHIAQLFGATVQQTLLTRVTDELKDFLMDCDLALFPAGVGGHLDHLLVCKAGEVLKGQGYEIVFYADQPYAITNDIRASCRVFWFAVNSEGVRRIKTEAASVYRSQPAATRLIAALGNLPGTRPVEVIMEYPSQ